MAKANESAYKDLHDKLDSLGQKRINKLSKTREREKNKITPLAFYFELILKPLLFPPEVTVLNFKPLNLNLTLQRINSAIESYATGTPCLILLLPLTPLFTSIKHFALYISKRHRLSTDTVNCHCQRLTYCSIVMFSTLNLHHTFAAASNSFCYYFYLL